MKLEKKLSECSIDELNGIASQIREKILGTVSANGGHLSSTLGATDLFFGHFGYEIGAR